jgi:predicted RNA-binding protein with EMAP domain
MNLSSILQQLKHSTQALALPSAMQFELFPNFVEIIDELALDFNHWFQCVLQSDNLLNDEQLQALQKLDQVLENLTKNKQAWSKKALKNGEEWNEVRQFAQDVLESFHWQVQMPPKDRSRYIPG